MPRRLIVAKLRSLDLFSGEVGVANGFPVEERHDQHLRKFDLATSYV